MNTEQIKQLALAVFLLLVVPGGWLIVAYKLGKRK